MIKDKDFTFWYPLLESRQLAFRDDGAQYKKEVFTEGEGHILYQGRLMCGESMNILKARLKAKKHSIKKVRVPDRELCEACREKYKKSESSAWSRWERGKAVEAGEVIKLA